MAKKKRNSILTKEQEKQLQNIANEMVGLAANLMDEYVEDFDASNLSGLSELSSSLGEQLTQIDMNSPYLDEIFQGESWKRVIRDIPSLKDVKKAQEELEKIKKDQKDDSK